MAVRSCPSIRTCQIAEFTESEAKALYADCITASMEELEPLAVQYL